MMANPLTYEIMTPESVGVAGTNLVLGKHSGRRVLDQRLDELGHPLTRTQLDEVYHRFTELADRKKNPSTTRTCSACSITTSPQ